MDIAEIRKKARSGKERRRALPTNEDLSFNKAESSEVAEPTIFATSELVADNAIQATTIEEQQDTACLDEKVPVSPSTTTLSGIEALFHWNPQAEISGDHEYVTRLEPQREGLEAELCRWLAFSLGNEVYALDISCIREIIKPREITDIPRVPGFLLGIISLRGNIIPVLDLKNRLRLGIADITPTSRIVVCQEGELFAGLLVDSISQVVSLPIESVEPPPAVLSGIARELVEGVGRVQGNMLVLLQLRSVLDIELS